jgi:tRNA nucleotidyltransferase (CCA-adding enzyme)
MANIGGVNATSSAQAIQLEADGFVKCRNPLCNFYNAPEVSHAYLGIMDDIENGMGDPVQLEHTCPWCGFKYNYAAVPGAKANNKKFAPGGGTVVGLSLDDMGELGEQLVQQVGKTDLAGYGPILWWSKYKNSALDGMVQDWGIEVKAVNWNAENKRFIVAPKDRATKNQAAQDPKYFADILGDTELGELIDRMKIKPKGILGILVLLDFETSRADIYAREFPLTTWYARGKPYKGVVHFRHHTAVPIYQNVPFDNPLPNPNTEGFVPHHERPPETTDFGAFSKVAALKPWKPGLWGKEFLVNGKPIRWATDKEEGSPHHLQAIVELGLNDEVDAIEKFRTIKPDGTSNDDNWSFSKTADGGWGGDAYPGEEPETVADRSYDVGSPTGGEYKFVYGNGELRVSPDDDHRALQGYMGIDSEYSGPFAVGYVHVDNDSATWEVNTNVGLKAMHRILKDYTDKVGWRWHGLTDIKGQPINDDFAPKKGGNDNVIKRHEDLEQWNIYDPTPNDDQRNPDERQPGGVFKCPDCDRLFPDWRTYSLHRDQELGPANTVDEDGKFPELNNDAIFRPHFTEQQPFTDVVAAKAPKDLIEDPVPFIYDIEEDAIYTGHPGAKHSDIHGEFTPGGIVEGVYEPGGKVSLRTMTNMPYTVRHLIELWYWQHPEFEVRGVWLEDEQGGRTKLAANNPGPHIKMLVSSDPAAWAAHKALSALGGKVYAVGGAVRDVLLDKQPKDIDLMVQGLPADDVRRALEALPGRVDLTGKDFGVFRYKHRGHEVEIALPRRERSTGDGHQDFDVQADHTMSVEEDLERRDFTANAAAVDLDTGQLIDPYNGKQDIKDGVLRTVTPKSFEEDPLRTVRALVAHARHGLHPDADTKTQMATYADRIKHLPAERVQAELEKIFESKNPASAIRLARESGVLKHILPEVDAAFGFDQNNPHHTHDLGTHLLHVLEHTQEKTDDPDVRLAALLHDIGKPDSAWTNPETGYNHYYQGPDGQGRNHDEHGAELAAARLRELKYPAKTIERVRSLVNHHMYPDFSSARGARRFVNRVGEHADDLMTLREADRNGKGTDDYQNTKTPVEVQRGLVEELRQKQEPTKMSDLAINGNDLMDIGYVPGPLLGKKLQELTQLVVEDPSLNNRETLLEMANG